MSNMLTTLRNLLIMFHFLILTTLLIVYKNPHQLELGSGFKKKVYIYKQLSNWVEALITLIDITQFYFIVR